MRLLRIETINEFIETIKLRGELVGYRHNVVEIPNNKYAEISMLFYAGVFYTTYTVLDIFEEIVYWEDIEAYEFEYQAENDYDNLPQSLNIEIDE